jgi:hypothetical protein
LHGTPPICMKRQDFPKKQAEWVSLSVKTAFSSFSIAASDKGI